MSIRRKVVHSDTDSVFADTYGSPGTDDVFHTYASNRRFNMTSGLPHSSLFDTTRIISSSGTTREYRFSSSSCSSGASFRDEGSSSSFSRRSRTHAHPPSSITSRSSILQRRSVRHLILGPCR